MGYVHHRDYIDCVSVPLRAEDQRFLYLDEAGVLEDLVGVTDEFELLHYGHRLIQVQDDSCGCNTEVSLQGENSSL